MKPECKTLRKVLELAFQFYDKNDDIPPEFLAYVYLAERGYWAWNDKLDHPDRVKMVPFDELNLIEMMNAVAEELRKGKTIEEITSDHRFCSPEEEPDPEVLAYISKKQGAE